MRQWHELAEWSPGMTITAGLAAFCFRAGTEPLPAAVQQRARLCVADHLHAAMRGARTETATRLMRYLNPDGGAPAPTAEAAALFLGAASTVYEIDDVHHDTSMHTGSVVVSAALGCLAERPSSGRRLLAAIAAGYEVAIRVSIAAGERHYQYFHSTATCGTIAAAATAAILYELDPEQMSNAMGLAATSASGLWEDINDGAIGVKHLHSGFAAERGIRAAKLAHLGLRAARRSIEGERGFLAALAGRPSAAPGDVQEILLAGLGERWTILRNIFKRYPFCLACFEPLEGIRHLVEAGRRPIDDVRSVLVALYPRSASIVGQTDPQNQLQAKFSATFAVALVLAGRDPEDATLPEEWLVDPAVRRWYPHVRVLADSTVPRRHARVTVCWNDGTEQCADRPLRSLSESEVWSRFAGACRQFGGARSGELEAVVAGAADLGDATELFRLVRAAVGM
jgi:2-methylcitrate dehydratase PrpD